MLSSAFGDAIDIVLVDKGDAFVFGFSKLDVMLGTFQEPSAALVAETAHFGPSRLQRWFGVQEDQ